MSGIWRRREVRTKQAPKQHPNAHAVPNETQLFNDRDGLSPPHDTALTFARAGASPPRKLAANRAAVPVSSLGNQCEYTLNVTPGFEWPSRCWTCVMGQP